MITGGNRLHVIFREDIRKIWYLTRELDSPQLAREPEQIIARGKSTAEIEIIGGSEPADVSAKSNQVLANSLEALPARIPRNSPALPVMVGLVPTVLLLVIALVISRRTSS